MALDINKEMYVHYKKGETLLFTQTVRQFFERNGDTGWVTDLHSLENIIHVNMPTCSFVTWH